MAMMKICPRCGSKHEYMKPCPNNCQEKGKREANEFYDKFQRKHSEFYNSSSWKLMRKRIIGKYSHMCVYSYMKNKRVVEANTVHHIVELNEDYSQRLVEDNLILVSDLAHREIHKKYKTNKKLAQLELRRMKEAFKSHF